MAIVEQAAAYVRRGWRVVPVYGLRAGVCECRRGAECAAPGKHPRIADWTDNATDSVAEVKRWWNKWPNSNVGVAWGSGYIDIEVDVDKGGNDTLKSLQAKLGKLPKTYTFRSGSGGLHRIYRSHARGGIEALGPGVDVLGDGRQSVMPPSVHHSGKKYELVRDVEVAILPDEWEEYLGQREEVVSSEVDPLDRDQRATVQEAEKLLENVPADDYDTWLRVGMALKSQWSDTQYEDEALAVWDRWSSRSGKYKPGDCAERWRSFKSAGTNFATVRWLAKEHGGTTRAEVEQSPEQKRTHSESGRRNVLKALKRAKTWKEIKAAAAAARSVELTADDADYVVRALVKAAKAVNESVTKREAADMIEYDRAGWFVGKAKALGWASKLFLQQGSVAHILEVSDGRVIEHGRDSFNASYAMCMANELGGAGKAAPIAEPWDVAVNLVDGNGDPVLPRVDGYGYKPGAGRTFMSASGTLVANTWVPWDGGTEELLWLPQEAADVALWRKHLKWLIGARDAALLVQFLAHVVQRPHKRINYCFTILGPEGCGKSMIASELMRAVMGTTPSMVGPATLGNMQYNDWMNASAFGCIDELHVDEGYNEYAIVNAIKPALTDPVLRISGKYRKSVQVHNVTTWMATSNFMVPFRMQSESRRWYFARTSARTLAEVNEMLGGAGERAEYFRKLIRAANRSPSALRGWLMGVDLGDFDPSHAPRCEHMHAMMDASADPANGLIAAAFESGERFLNPECVGLRFLKAWLEEQGDGSIRWSDRMLVRKLLDMGYHVVMRNDSPWRTATETKDHKRRTTWLSKNATIKREAMRALFKESK